MSPNVKSRNRELFPWALSGAQNTNYFFDVAHPHLEEALDIFAQFFISPLMTEGATDREMQASLSLKDVARVLPSFSVCSNLAPLFSAHS